MSVVRRVDLLFDGCWRTAFRDDQASAWPGGGPLAGTQLVAIVEFEMEGGTRVLVRYGVIDAREIPHVPMGSA